MRRIFTAFAIIMAVFHFMEAHAQERTISGRVISAEDNTGLPGVNILIKGTSEGTVTDTEGKFRLSVPDQNAVLVFSFVGFETQEVQPQNRAVINITLRPDYTEMAQVVVTSFGIEQEKKSLGYAVQELGSEEITKTKQQNVVSALQGQVAGVQVTNAGGAPGQSARIIIRGVNSLDPSADNQPLFVVDGVPIDNSTIEDSDRTPRGLSNRAADINPNDIESMTVLKGAAATALYGVRAANGAVIITTKKGRAGAVRVNINSTVGFEEVNRYPRIQEVYGQGFSGQYNPNDFWPSWGAPIAAVADTVPGYQFENNWEDAMNTGRQIDNSVSVSGGNENATFYGSFSRLDQKGIIPFSEWDRSTAKLSGDIKISDQFNFSGSVNYINSGGNRVPHDRFMERMVYWAATQDVTDYINPDGTMKTYGNTNPIYDARFSTFQDDVNRVIGNLMLNYKPTEWLSFTYRVGTDYYSDSRTEITPGPMGIDGELPLSSIGFIRETRINSRDLNSNLFMTLNNEFSEKFRTTLRVGNDIFERDYERVDAYGENFVIPNFYDLSYASQISNSQDKRKRRLVGLYGDLMLDYDNFLFLNVTGRNDWSSTLPEANNSFFYPSVNLGFVFSEAFDFPRFLSFGKLRASWAKVGKDTDPHLLGATYAASDVYPLNGQVGFSRVSRFGDPELKPEETYSVEFGTNLQFLSNRLGVDFTWYKSNSRNQIIPVPISDATGYSVYITNAGEIENRGIELMLTGSPIRSSDFSWDITVNLSNNNNTVVNIREGIDEIVVGSQFGYVGSTVTMKLVEGEPYGNIYGSSYQRYYPDGTPENLTHLDADRPLVIGANGFPIRNGNQLILGNAIPKWFGGVRNTLNYKGLDFSFLVDFRADVEQYNQYDNFFSAFGIAEYTLARNETRVFNGVTAEGSPNTQEVWLGQGVGPDGVDYGAGYYRNHYRSVSENFVHDASFIKLRNISLGYNLQPGLLDATPFRSARIAVTANNIILYTPWDGFDPESFSAGAGGNAVGFTGLGYPGVRSLLFTLNLGF
ncbi:SusC/RagA family TonB-linked outer membrane protein [Cesiribacter sp. SM1]|uniref:SusC/RagA family TonB-linked outer membrane protein n=1 Tax=Cesiribacter sp. SM1 TaxID=2861196 RepID=UPI001CD7B59B|nr:SusC/RagA family TonB-linked outer membrane protein [Cesiribacter sp. SM1]